MNKLLSIIMIFFLSNANADSLENAKQFVDTNSKKVIEILDSHVDSVARLDNLFFDVMDINWMAQFVVGKHWRSFSDAQKESYLAVYKDYLASIYVSKYKEYNKNKYRIYSVIPMDNKQYLVSTLVDWKSSEDLKIEYRLKEYGSTFKVRDIITADVSLISTQRADFSSFLSANSIDNLISNLKAKIE